MNAPAPALTPDRLPLPAATPILAYGPIRFDVPGRQAPMEVRVTVPATGGDLPVILLSHGHGASNFLSSIRGYGPLVDFYGAHGFVVVQVTRQDSKTLALDPKGPEGATFWRSRAEDFHYILDHLDAVEAQVPGLAGRVDRSRIAVVGHSMGGHTSALLAGATVTDMNSGEKVNLSEPRIKAFVMISPAGDGKDAAPWLRENYPETLETDYGTMTAPALVIVGDADFNANFSTRLDWRADAYNQAPGPKTLLTVFGAEHIFGGISGWMRAKPRTRIRPGWRKCSGSPGPMSAQRFTRRTGPGRTSWRRWTGSAAWRPNDPSRARPRRRQDR